MLSVIKNQTRRFFQSGHERTRQVRKNVLYAFLIKAVGIITGFLLVPLTIGYVDAVQYGIWITIFSIVNWLNTFDIGLSNGLRNKLAHAIALKQSANGVTYVTTTYVMLLFIASVAFVLFAGLGWLFNWNKLLGLDINLNVFWLLLITMACFCMQFVLQPINTILIAKQQSFKASFLLVGGQLLALATVYLLKLYNGHGSLVSLIIAVAGAPILVSALASVYLYKTTLKQFTPKLSSLNLAASRSLFSVGGVFFAIQLGALVLYETDNIIITKMLGPGQVTSFNIAFKYFSLLTVVFAIIITPYWSAFTDAYAKADFDWMRRAVKKMYFIFSGFVIIAGVMYLGAGIFYHIWVKDVVKVPAFLSVTIAVGMLMQIWLNINAYVLNGVGKLRLQLILVISTGIINIPLSVLLVRKFGLPGTIMANIIVMLIMNIVFTRQCRLIINQRASGVWNK